MPSMAEMLEAVKRLRNGKAAGSNGILLEMLKVECTMRIFTNHHSTQDHYRQLYFPL